jgi:transcriptional regulator with XRE-family HTH domain
METSELILFNKLVKTIQKDKGLTLEEVADLLNISRAHFSRMKNGHKKITPKILLQTRKLANYSANDAIEEHLWGTNKAAEPKEKYQHNNNALSELVTDTRHKRQIIDMLLSDQEKRTRQMDDIIKELQKVNDQLIKQLNSQTND